MLGKGEKRLVAAYSAAHFAVDLCCAMLVLPAARAASSCAGPDLPDGPAVEGLEERRHQGPYRGLGQRDLREPGEFLVPVWPDHLIPSRIKTVREGKSLRSSAREDRVRAWILSPSIPRSDMT